MTSEYLQRCRALLEVVERQSPAIQQAAGWFADSILAGRMVHLFGSGHSRILVEEMWPRYGSFPGFNPIVELSLSFHNLVVGANGQRQAMFLENVSGLAERILRNFDVSDRDCALVASSSGRPSSPSPVPVCGIGSSGAAVPKSGSGSRSGPSMPQICRSAYSSPGRSSLFQP